MGSRALVLDTALASAEADFSRRFAEIATTYAKKAAKQLKIHQERSDAQIRQLDNLIGSRTDDVQRAQEFTPALAGIFRGAQVDGRDLNKSRIRYEEIVASARAEHAQISVFRDEAQAAWSAVSARFAEMDRLLADASAARDQARSEAAEIARIAQAARTDYDGIRSEVLDTVRKIAEKKVQRWVETAHSATTDAHAINTTRSRFNDALQTAREDTSTISARRDEKARTATAAVSLDNIMSEALATDRGVPMENVVHRVENAMSVEDGALNHTVRWTAVTKITINSWVLDAITKVDSDHVNPETLPSVELPVLSCADDGVQAPPCIVQGIRPPAEPPPKYATIGFLSDYGGAHNFALNLLLLWGVP
jgi:hypothetical protein